jgi:hypothetical protein
MAAEICEPAGDDHMTAAERAQQVFRLRQGLRRIDIVHDEKAAGMFAEPIEHRPEADRLLGGVPFGQVQGLRPASAARLRRSASGVSATTNSSAE